MTAAPEEVALEEGYVTFPALPGGFLAKAGKMRDAFGKVNAQHPHTLPWIDRPLVTTNLTGGEEGLADAGISVARLVPNPWLFLEATGQVYQGNSSIFQAPTRSDLAWVGRLRAYRDLGESTNLDLGESMAYGHNGITADTTTRLVGADATLRWKPLRRAIYTHVLARGEATWRPAGVARDGKRPGPVADAARTGGEDRERGDDTAVAARRAHWQETHPRRSEDGWAYAAPRVTPPSLPRGTSRWREQGRLLASGCKVRLPGNAQWRENREWLPVTVAGPRRTRTGFRGTRFALWRR